MKLYASYGVLGREKVAVLSIDRPCTQFYVVYDLRLPDSWNIIEPMPEIYYIEDDKGNLLYGNDLPKKVLRYAKKLK